MGFYINIEGTIPLSIVAQTQQLCAGCKRTKRLLSWASIEEIIGF